MARPRILDTHVLINHFAEKLQNTRKRIPGEFRRHAQALIDLQGTNQIVSPVRIEFLAGARRDDLECRKAYLEPFNILDKRIIPAQDWSQAENFAKWVRIGRERKLGDCLMQAIAERLNGDIISGDRDFKLRVPPKEKSMKMPK